TPVKVVEAIQQQATKMIHYMPSYMFHEPEIELAERICQLTPGNFAKKVTFGLSGSDANDALIKFARAYTGRPYIVTFENSYHGTTYGAISMSAMNPRMKAKMGPFVGGMAHIPFPDNYRGLYGKKDPETLAGYLAPFKQMLKTYLPAEEVACVVVETLQGDAGLLEPVPGYFNLNYS